MPRATPPERAVGTLSDLLGLRVPGDPTTHPNRVQGVAALATGVALGAGIAAVDEATDGTLGRLPVPASTLLFAYVALAGANGPMAVWASPTPGYGHRATGPAT